MLEMKPDVKAKSIEMAVVVAVEVRECEMKTMIRRSISEISVALLDQLPWCLLEYNHLLLLVVDNI